MKGLEPSHLAVLEPKSSASANSATSAYWLYYHSRDLVKHAQLGLCLNFLLLRFHPKHAKIVKLIETPSFARLWVNRLQNLP